MGVKYLWDILESCKKTIPLDHLQNKRICIDLSCWIVQLNKSNRSPLSIKDKLHLRGLFHRLRALLALNCSLILVADGSIPSVKLSTYRRRLNSESKVSGDETDSLNACSLRRNMGSVFSCMIKEAKVLSMALGIPCIVGVEEAEAQCALLNSESLCDGCFTSDSDVFLFGARTVYRDICLGEGGYVVCYEMDDIERTLGLGRNSMITLAILLGSDYSPGVHGVGRESACQIIKTIGESSVLQRLASEGLSFVNKFKGSRKQGREHCSQGDNQFVPVIDAYLRPKCHSAESPVVNQALGPLPFDRAELQKLCAQFFEWPPEKTDEYILPKIAERELRKFANLRNTSSELGLWPPLDKMPVRCPVSDIIKHCKSQGREYYLVSWDKIDGLKTSTVPADLIQSACPEKIGEFEERKAQAKKQKPRAKKSAKMAPISEIDNKLQELLLDIEREHVAAQNDILFRHQMAESVTENGQVNKKQPLDEDLNCNLGRFADKGCHDAASSVHKADVIDLLSPSPPVRDRKVPKSREIDVQCVDVINLSDSEFEASPEHARKARDLRVFLASIRENS